MRSQVTGQDSGARALLVLRASRTPGIVESAELDHKYDSALMVIDTSVPLLISEPVFTYLGQSSVDDEIGSVDEAALIASKENDGVRLLDGLAKTTRGEVNFAPEALGLVVTKPVLKERSAIVCQYMDPR